MLVQVGLYVLVAIIAGAIGCLFSIIASKLSEDGMETVKNWLWFAIFNAEQIYGEKTGELKLQSVYNNFVNTFPKLSKKISFATFSYLVDEVLEQVNNSIKDNENIKKIVEEYKYFKSSIN